MNRRENSKRGNAERYSVLGVSNSNTGIRGHQMTGGLLPMENRHGEVILSGLANKVPAEGSSIRPTGQLSNSRRLT